VVSSALAGAFVWFGSKLETTPLSNFHHVCYATNAGQSNSGKGAPRALPGKDKHPQGQTAKPGTDRNDSKPNKSAGQGADESNDDHDQSAEG